MKNVILKIGGLVVIGMLCTLVPASLFAVCGDGSLDGSLKITPSTLNLSNPSQSAVIMAHISGDNLGALGNEFQITCINDNILSTPIYSIPGMANGDGEVLNIGFYRKNLIDAIKDLEITETATITVAQSGSVNIGKSFETDIPTDIYTGNISGFTNLNLGEADQPGVILTYAVVDATGTDLCPSIGYGEPLTTINLSYAGCTIDLTNATLLVTVYASSYPVTFSGITLSGSGGSTTGGVIGSDVIKLK